MSDEERTYLLRDSLDMAVDKSVRTAGPAYFFFKRILDIVASTAGLIVFSPLFLLISLLIKRDSEGPVFFVQRRCGKDGIGFDMYKFRTMVKDAHLLRDQIVNEAEGSVFKVKDDPRVTSIGKFLRNSSLDELPQLLNILKGEMSLVGPRPLADEEMSADREWKKTRLSVKPGLTGLWQIKGRGDMGFSNWLRYDKEYVRNQSMITDIKILFMTIGYVLKKKGAY